MVSSTILTGIGTINQGANATLNINHNAFTVTNLSASAANNNVNYNLAGVQNIFGTQYANLGIAGGSNKTLLNNLSVSGTLTHTSGILLLGANNLSYGNSASIAGTPSATNMILVNGTGFVEKKLEYSSA